MSADNNPTVSIDAWALREIRAPDAPGNWAPSAVTDALFTLANGALGVRGTLDEGSFDATAPTAAYLNGTYDALPISFPHDEYNVTSSLERCDMFRAPDAAGITATLGHGAPLTAATGEACSAVAAAAGASGTENLVVGGIVGGGVVAADAASVEPRVIAHSRTLDLREARVERSTRWQLPHSGLTPPGGMPSAPPTAAAATAAGVDPLMNPSPTIPGGGETCDGYRGVAVSSTRIVPLGQTDPVLCIRYKFASEGYTGNVTIACTNDAPAKPWVSTSVIDSHERAGQEASVLVNRASSNETAANAATNLGSSLPTNGGPGVADTGVGGTSMNPRIGTSFDNGSFMPLGETIGMETQVTSEHATACSDLSAGTTVVTVQASGSRAYVACAATAVCRHIAADGGYQRCLDAEDDVSRDGRGSRTVFRCMVHPGDCVVVDRYVAYASTLDAERRSDNVIDESLRVLRELTSAGGFDRISAEHAEATRAIWATSDIAIDGDDAMQGTVRANILQCAMNAGRRRLTSLAMKGLTGDLLSGRYSWDGEVFVMPFLAWTQPCLARALLQFRIDTLEAAKGRVRDLLLPRGALYPWRTIDGTESHAATACTMQLHINADIAYAFQQYLAATGDFQLFLDGGADVVLSMALVWLHWGTWERGKFHLRYVTGPDEYNVLVNDNCFTNLMAANHLKFASQLGTLVASHAPHAWEALCARIDLDAGRDLADMQRAAEGMYVPFDPDHRVYLQDDGFLRKKPWAIGGTLQGVDTRQRPHVVLSERYHPLAIYRHRVCKQADVLLAQHLLSSYFAPDAKQANFRYYEHLTTHDSSLTTSTFSCIASSLGFGAKAYEYFRRTACVDVHNIVGNTAEGLHMAAMGGSWSAIVTGFAGLRIDAVAACASLHAAPTLHFDPYVPERWTGYRFAVMVRGAVVEVEVNRSAAAYRLRTPTQPTKHANQRLQRQRDDVDHRQSGFGGDQQYQHQHQHQPRDTITPSLPKTVVIAHGPERRFRLLLDGDWNRVPLHRAYVAPSFDAVIFDVAALVAHVEDDHYKAWREVLDPILAAATSMEGATPMSALGQLDIPPSVPFGRSLDTVAAGTLFGGNQNAARESSNGTSAATGAAHLTPEQYFAYIRYHPVVGNRRFGGLARLLGTVGFGDIPYGDADDAADVHTVCGLANKKKLAFRQLVKSSGGVQPADGAEALLRELKSQKMLVGCASSSRNAEWLLAEAGLRGLVDAVVDGSSTSADRDDWRDGELLRRCVAKVASKSASRAVVVVESIAGLSRTALSGLDSCLVCCTDGDNEAQEESVARQYGIDVVIGPLANVSVEDLQKWALARGLDQHDPASATGSSPTPSGPLGGAVPQQLHHYADPMHPPPPSRGGGGGHMTDMQHRSTDSLGGHSIPERGTIGPDRSTSQGPIGGGVPPHTHSRVASNVST